ncbi:hypothetical protein WJX73_006654 [Symbiochloris irregularis]|uniref:Uncharacterized protein n=1 Tax=Symbiochloris irregularis TaxID=706552 RepID=A0AAW1NNS3_9CHLO
MYWRELCASHRRQRGWDHFACQEGQAPWAMATCRIPLAGAVWAEAVPAGKSLQLLGPTFQAQGGWRSVHSACFSRPRTGPTAARLYGRQDLASCAFEDGAYKRLSVPGLQPKAGMALSGHLLSPHVLQSTSSLRDSWQC